MTDGNGTEIGWGQLRLRLIGQNGVIILLLIVLVVGFVYSVQAFNQASDKAVRDHATMAREMKLLRCWVSFPERERMVLYLKSEIEIQARCPWLKED